MAKTFGTMKTNVGNEVQDTTAAFATLIGVWLNRRYQQVLRETNWNIINADYTIAVTSAAQDYELPSDFGKEISCTDTTNGEELARTDLQKLWQDYPDSIADDGTVARYAIYRSDDNKQYIKFHYAPATSITVALPYIPKPADMSATGDYPIIPVEDLLELGAISDAWRYKRQGSKAGDYETRFGVQLMQYIWNQENQPNQVQQFTPVTYDKDNLY